MAHDVARDRLALIRIQGMHCHKCETTIQKALARHPGVNEVEVDFASGLASVLYNRDSVQPNELIQAIIQAGYQTVDFTQRDPEG